MPYDAAWQVQAEFADQASLEKQIKSAQTEAVKVIIT